MSNLNEITKSPQLTNLQKNNSNNKCIAIAIQNKFIAHAHQH